MWPAGRSLPMSELDTQCYSVKPLGNTAASAHKAVENQHQLLLYIHIAGPQPQYHTVCVLD